MGGGVIAPDDGALYLGEVVHKRSRPARHSLRYSVFSMLVDLDQLEALDRGLRLFSVGRFNLFSLNPKEFGPHDGSSIAHFIRAKAAAAGLGEVVTRIRMLCYPRILGFAFNPVTVYYLDDADGATPQRLALMADSCPLLAVHGLPRVSHAVESTAHVAKGRVTQTAPLRASRGAAT